MFDITQNNFLLYEDKFYSTFALLAGYGWPLSCVQVLYVSLYIPVKIRWDNEDAQFSFVFSFTCGPSRSG